MIPLPETWTETKLGMIAKDMFSGGTPSTKNPDFWQGNIPWLTSKSIGESIFLTAGEKTISEEAVRKSATQIVPAGNLIFATRVGVGKVVVTKIDVAISQDGTGIIVDPTEVDPTFLAFNLRSDSVQRYIEQNKRGATIQGITKTALQQADILLPPLTEQRNIAYVLSTAQTAIEQQERLIALTRELKSALMRKLFKEGLRGEKQKETEIGFVPESWEVVNVASVYIFTSRRKGTNLPSPVPFIPMELIPIEQNTISNFEERTDISSGTYVENGDLLVAKITPSFENGKQGILNIPYENAFATTEVIPIKAIDGKSSLLYLHYFLLIPEIRTEIAGKMEGSTGRQRLSKTIIGEQLIPLPSVQEQEEIAKRLAVFDRKIILAQKKQEFLSDIFRSLLHQLMTGQIRVNDIELESLN